MWDEIMSGTSAAVQNSILLQKVFSLAVRWSAIIRDGPYLLQLVIEKAFEIQNSKPSAIASLGGKGISGFRYLRIQVGCEYLSNLVLTSRNRFIDAIVSG
jgi:hypothetical protein